MSETLENIDPSAQFTMLKGDPGTTKSSQAITWPKPQYWIPFDGKMKSLMRAMKAHNVSGKDIHFDSYDSFAPALRKLEQFQLQCPYQTVVIDSITTGSDIALRDIRKNKGTSTQNKGNTTREIGGFAVNILEDFNGEASALSELVSLCMYLYEHKNVNIVLIAHVTRKEQKDATGKTNVVRQIVTAARNAAQKIPAVCTEIYQFDMLPSLTGGDPDIIVRTTHTSEDYARTSLPLPSEIKLGYSNLYEGYVLPAINQLKGM